MKTKQYFDSANIAESYSGIVLPLTQSFAKMVYCQVYLDLLKMSGVSSKKLQAHSEIFENLLGFFYGRMYYNMNNWYLMAAFVPGYKRNKKNFELMITSNIKEEISTNIKPTFLFTLFYPLIVSVKISIYGLTTNYFKNTVAKELILLQNQNFNELDYKDCIKLFEQLNKKLLRKWYIAIENDFFVMTYLGLLKKFLDDESLQKVIKFRSKSTEQVTALSILSKKIYTEKKLWKFVETRDVKSFEQELPKHQHIQNLLKEYFRSFGGRFANELKLESVSVDEDTTKLFQILQVYKDYKIKQNFQSAEKPKLPFFQKALFNIILNKFKNHASLREEFRLLRSNTFGMARRLFKRMGAILAQKGIIENIEDVFYLNLEELLNPNATSNKALVKLIRQRKSQFNSYSLVNPPTHFDTTDNLPPPIEKNISYEKNVKATPASPGIIRGKVRIFKDFSMPEKIDFDILVTSHTDPGWTSLIALSKGLIIEHGGVLSHASIVARELEIPAVIGAKNAMQILKNHQLVEINGSTGEIKIIK